jgi:hypothetical protein
MQADGTIEEEKYNSGSSLLIDKENSEYWSMLDENNYKVAPVVPEFTIGKGSKDGKVIALYRDGIMVNQVELSE